MLIHFSQEQVDSLRRQVRAVGCSVLRIEWLPKDRLPIVVIDGLFAEDMQREHPGEFRAGELDGRD